MRSLHTVWSGRLHVPTIQRRARAKRPSAARVEIPSAVATSETLCPLQYRASSTLRCLSGACATMTRIRWRSSRASACSSGVGSPVVKSENSASHFSREVRTLRLARMARSPNPYSHRIMDRLPSNSLLLSQAWHNASCMTSSASDGDRPRRQAARWMGSMTRFSSLVLAGHASCEGFAQVWPSRPRG